METCLHDCAATFLDTFLRLIDVKGETDEKHTQKPLSTEYSYRKSVQEKAIY